MRSILATLLVATAVFVAVGCGGSSNDAAGTTDAVDTTEVADTTADTSTEATTDAMTETDSTATDTTASGLSEGCEDVADFSKKFSNALGEAGAGGTSADLEATANAYVAAADSAPEEIREAFKTLATAYVAYAKALEGVDLSAGSTPSPETIAKLVEASKELNTAGLADASTQIAEWVSTNCTGTG